MIAAIVLTVVTGIDYLLSATRGPTVADSFLSFILRFLADSGNQLGARPLH